jgi:Transglutaminase-like superfamily
MVKSERLRMMDLALLIEAATMLFFFRVALAVVSFRRLMSWIQPSETSAQSVSQPAIIRRVRRGVLAVVKKSPVPLACFPQSLACYFMLRRRGLSATLYYGVARTGPRLEAHTWLKVGEQFVVGGEVSPRFVVLTRFGSIEPPSPDAIMIPAPE